MRVACASPLIGTFFRSNENDRNWWTLRLIQIFRHRSPPTLMLSLGGR